MTWDFGGYVFTSPKKLNIPLQNDHKGIYSIGRTTDSDKSIRRVYIGETHDQTFDERITKSHHQYDCWNDALENSEYLVVSFYNMDDSTDDEIKKVELDLRSKKSTSCNEN